MGDREAMAARAGVAKGTFVRFRARVFDPIKAAFSDYQTKAAGLSRVLKVGRAEDDPIHEPVRYKYGRAGVMHAPHGTMRGKDGAERPIVDHYA